MINKLPQTTSNTMASYFREIKQMMYLLNCSAGVGRTGTIILSDICLRMAAGEEQIDPLKYLNIIREQRVNLVDNFVSFIYVTSIVNNQLKFGSIFF